MTGTITLSFFTLEPDGSLTQHRSKQVEYADMDEARVAAKEALERFTHITYAEICVRPAMGSARGVEKVGRS